MKPGKRTTPLNRAEILSLKESFRDALRDLKGEAFFLRENLTILFDEIELLRKTKGDRK
jgi:hypothetical protein